MHVPNENLPRYRRLKKLHRHVDSIGNRRSNRGDYSGANAAWRRAGQIMQAAQSLRAADVRPTARSIMPRPSLGQSTKSEIVTIRLTKREVEELSRQYGSAGKGLRALLSARLRPTYREKK